MQTVIKSGFLIRPEVPHCNPATRMQSKSQDASVKEVASSFFSEHDSYEREASLEAYYEWSEKGLPLP